MIRLNSSQLKWFAIVTMFIDHFGHVVLGKLALAYGVSVDYLQLFEISTLQGLNTILVLYWTCRIIGRLAFPLFAFFIVEGFTHTRNRWKYLARLSLFALISEVPFNLMTTSKLWSLDYQNVLITFVLAIWCLIIIDFFKEDLLVVTLSTLVFSILATWLKTDYAWFGIVLIVVLYVFRHHRGRQLLAGAVLSVYQFTAVVSFALLALYNGKKGQQPKWLFYWFYPVHIVILVAIAHLI